MITVLGMCNPSDKFVRMESKSFPNICFLVLQNFSFTPDLIKVRLGKEFLKELCQKVCQTEAINISIQDQLLEKLAQLISSLFPNTSLQNVMSSFGNYLLEFGFEFPPYPLMHPRQFDYCKKNCFVFKQKGIVGELKLLLKLFHDNKESQLITINKKSEQEERSNTKKTQENHETKFTFVNKQHSHQRYLQLNPCNWQTK